MSPDPDILYGSLMAGSIAGAGLIMAAGDFLLTCNLEKADKKFGKPLKNNDAEYAEEGRKDVVNSSKRATFFLASFFIISGIHLAVNTYIKNGDIDTIINGPYVWFVLGLMFLLMFCIYCILPDLS